MIDYSLLYDLKNPFSKYWIEYEKDLPDYAKNIVKINFEDFQNKFFNFKDTNDKQKLIKSLLSGDVYILKNAFSRKFMEDLKDFVIKEKFKPGKFEFHKIYDGVPNFSRNITPDLSHKYSIKMVKMTSYFFPFNELNSNFNLYEEVYKKWRVLKFISGYEATALEKNIPSDGLVDRIQVVRYPINSGLLEPHKDPYLYQKFFISSYFSKKGIDFEKGGFYVSRGKNDSYDMENELDIGDLCFGIATINHEVKIAEGKGRYKNNDLRSGRWFLGLYSTESDYSKQRHTTMSLK